MNIDAEGAGLCWVVAAFFFDTKKVPFTFCLPRTIVMFLWSTAMVPCGFIVLVVVVVVVVVVDVVVVLVLVIVVVVDVDVLVIVVVVDVVVTVVEVDVVVTVVVVDVEVEDILEESAKLKTSRSHQRTSCSSSTSSSLRCHFFRN